MTCALVDEEGKALLHEALSLTGGRPHVRRCGEACYEVISEGTRSGMVRLLVNLSEEAKVVEGTTVPPHATVLERTGAGPLVFRGWWRSGMVGDLVVPQGGAAHGAL